MKKNRPGKRPPRLSTRILLAVLAAAPGGNGLFCMADTGEASADRAETQTAGSLSPEEQKRLDAQEERDNEIAESGSVGYSPSRERLNDREAGTVYDESSALDALEALQYDMNIGMSGKNISVWTGRRSGTGIMSPAVLAGGSGAGLFAGYGCGWQRTGRECRWSLLRNRRI